ncbi:uncharacterized protein EV420DRAFT_1274146 [Desarmillaria tabescens]|uniref:Uncharacterized protein n=1 Tax=Armillaria tabescens TaxID=1929756 RepID=A0AA39JZ48_ARMTA|nr:uncharacterized protein EV420DRAFT_1274146 [Desarmillaria tabescens]KAK0451418.1 hypothetical protein EV420DRAFT_1274146 [Desarmillaria tabescens]
MNEHEDHIPSDDDVISVKRILNSHLPVEIIDDILDLAQYWPHVRERRRMEVKAAADHQAGETFPKAEWCYIVSPPIPQDAKVHTVKFVIESRDQGSGGEPEHQGTYEGSWTWFEAAIIRGEPWWLRKVLTMPVDLYREEDGSHVPQDVRSAARAAEVRSREEDETRWHEHTIVWPRTDEEIEQHPMRGLIGLSHEFVRLLEPGDRVALMARAMFPAWINKVKCASIDVFYTL